MAGICVLCEKPTGRKHNPDRPCCNKCEKTAPMAIQAPGLFNKGPAASAAHAARKRSDELAKD